MHAFPADAAYSNQDLSPILIVGSSEAARERARHSVLNAGFRIADIVDLAGAPARLRLQGAASALWLELDSAADAPDLDAALASASEDRADKRYGAVVSLTPDLIEPVFAQLEGSDVEFVVDGTAAERATALAIVTSAFQPFETHDVASDHNNARLRQLSDEVSRIAATLARLSTGPGQPTRIQEAPQSRDVPEISVDTVRAVIRARRLRSRFFSEELFADPAWDMLLDLLQAELAQLRVPVSSLCIAAAVPATTALRWLKTMTNQGLFVRRADPHDGRRVFVELDPAASLALRRYFAEVGNPATI
jgi:DNA-binding MarR family transcriptional regulator